MPLQEVQQNNLTIEFYESLTNRLDHEQNINVKLGALIAVKNLILYTQLHDHILYGLLIDSISDPEKEVQELAIKIINKVFNPEVKELLYIKLIESNESTHEIITQILATNS